MKKILVLSFSLAFASLVQGDGLNWPTNRFLPSFSTPATPLDCIDISSASGAQIDLFTSLQGIVNRSRPRIACVYNSAEEGEFTWLTQHGLSYLLINGYSAILKYSTNISGLVVTDPNQPDTLNLATTIAGLKNELICDPSLVASLTNAPFNFTVKDDLRGLFTDKFQVYQYLYSNYWSQCTHRLIAGMETNGHGHLREYLVSVQSAAVWLNPAVPAEAAALAPFLSDMPPVGGVFLGWWPDETAGLAWIAQFGIPVLASDWFDNASVFSGVVSPINIPPIPAPPPLQNKVYVAIILSDGDNVQYMQHHMKKNWSNVARGSVPIGWTTQPLAADIDPGMLNYYWSSASTNDCLVAGPSGAGYTRLNYWSPANAAAYTTASNPYLQRSGMTSITVWMTVSSGSGHDFAASCPSLLGIYDHNAGNYNTNYGGLPVVGFPASANYSSSVTNLIAGITNSSALWNGSAPLFITVQGSGWNITPADCKTIANSLTNSEYVVVRPDHLFMLYREYTGLTNSGAPRIIEDLAPNQKLPAGFPLSLTAYAAGSPPLNYQWYFNGTPLTDNVRVKGSQGATLTVNPFFWADAGDYQAIISNASGFATSIVCNASLGRDAFSSPAGWSRNGRASPMTNNTVALTDGINGETSSVFLNSPQFIGKFAASFTYQDVGGGGADGCAFVLHNASSGPWALGAGGSGLGCGGISPGIAVEFNIYSANGVGMAIRTNGQAGPPYLGTSPVNLAGGNQINIAIAYDGSIFTVGLTDTVSHVTYSTNVALNLPAILGNNTAFVGMTAADGGISSRQLVRNFQFVSMTPLMVQATASNSVLIHWPNSAGGLALQQSTTLGSVWTVVADSVILAASSHNEVTLPVSGASRFYRLVTP